MSTCTKSKLRVRDVGSTMFGMNPDQRETEHRGPPLTDAIPNPKTRISET